MQQLQPDEKARGPRGGPEGVRRGSRGGPEGRRGSRGPEARESAWTSEIFDPVLEAGRAQGRGQRAREVPIVLF